MAYGKIKADAFIYDDNGNDAEITAASIASTANKADLASPAFTGTPTAPTAAAATNTTQLATTAFVTGAISDLTDSAPGTLDTLNELAAALGDDANFSTTVTNSIATKLPLAGGTLTGDLVLSGDPDANLKAATKQYVDTQVGSAAQTTGTTFTGDVSMQEALSIERVKEKATIITNSAGGVIPFDVKTQAVYWLQGNALSNYAFNIRGDGSTTLDSIMSVGEVMTIVGLVQYGSTAYYCDGITIDGTTSNRTLKWAGGAPSAAGTANAICAVTMSVFKTANGTFTVLANATEYET